MFCCQCSENLKGEGCTVKGVCGKEPEVANLQDMLIWLLKGISFWGSKVRQYGLNDTEVDLFVAEGLFTTITNVDFDPASLGKKIQKAFEMRDRVESPFRKAYRNSNGEEFHESVPEAAYWKVDGGLDLYELKGSEVGVLETKDEDIRSLRELLVYGLKGIAAYTDHAYILRQSADSIIAFLQEGLA